MEASAPPLEAFSDAESPSHAISKMPTPPLPELGALGVHEGYVRSLIRKTSDWPCEGVTFLDISPLLCDARALKDCVDCLVQRYGGGYITHVAGIDARGFTLGCALAYALNCGFVMIRKSGKLPPASSSSLVSSEYEMEYGTAQLQMSADLFDTSTVTVPRVLLVDDILATGATATAACNVLRDVGATIVEVAVLAEILSTQLNGRKKLKEEAYIEVHALLTFTEDGG